MSLVQRAVSSGARIAWTGVINSFQSGEGFSVLNQKGQTGDFKGYLKSLASQAYKATLRNVKENLKSLQSFYMEDLKRNLTSVSNYARLNQVEWADTRLWEIRIDGLPKPFQGFAPISNASVSAITVNLGTFNIGNTSWQYVESQGNRHLTLTILDDVTGAMEEFLYQWMDEISGRKVGGVVPIEKAGKIIRFRKLSRGKLLTSEVKMFCVPQGTLTIDNNQSSRNPRTIDITFAILGVQRSRVSQGFPYRDMSQVSAQVTENLARRNRSNSGVRANLSRFLT